MRRLNRNVLSVLFDDDNQSKAKVLSGEHVINSYQFMMNQ